MHNSKSDLAALDLSDREQGTAAVAAQQNTFTISVQGMGEATFQYSVTKQSIKSILFESKVVSAAAQLQSRVSADRVILQKTGNSYSNGKITVSELAEGSYKVTSYYGQTPEATGRGIQNNVEKQADQQLKSLSGHSPEIDQLYQKNCPDLFNDNAADTKCSFEHNGKSYGGSSSRPMSDAEWNKHWNEHKEEYRGTDLERDIQSGKF